MSPTTRRARALRIAGIVLSVALVVLASPLIIAKLFADAKGERR